MYTIQIIEELKCRRADCARIFKEAVSDYMVAVSEGYPDDITDTLTRQISSIQALHDAFGQQIRQLSYIYN